MSPTRHIEDGEPRTSRAFEVGRAERFIRGSGLRVRIPVTEMIEIGAGGGSIASVDELSRLRVGPRSAGSDPGPACDGRGGERPTVTDADAVAGYLDPDAFAEGRLRLDLDLARRAVERDVGAGLGTDAAAGADGVSQMVDEAMANAARMHAVEQGKNVDDCAVRARPESIATPTLRLGQSGKLTVAACYRRGGPRHRARDSGSVTDRRASDHDIRFAEIRGEHPHRRQHRHDPPGRFGVRWRTCRTPWQSADADACRADRSRRRGKRARCTERALRERLRGDVDPPPGGGRGAGPGPHPHRLQSDRARVRRGRCGQPVRGPVLRASVHRRRCGIAGRTRAGAARECRYRCGLVDRLRVTVGSAEEIAAVSSEMERIVAATRHRSPAYPVQRRHG